ncbi:hypothetical protein MDA_GLEAN10017346 [Myotis davidii]|uniref:Uncharacterized protein n=1 Tax=Myotis davidii TaxID=225400 RepID=L5LH48_MYODS|nr:hypothetical protein MDA_GLEAN10017346 [Myotis davidii]
MREEPQGLGTPRSSGLNAGLSVPQAPACVAVRCLWIRVVVEGLFLERGDLRLRCGVVTLGAVRMMATASGGSVLGALLELLSALLSQGCSSEVGSAGGPPPPRGR